jgi:hypothetical protein
MILCSTVVTRFHVIFNLLVALEDTDKVILKGLVGYEGGIFRVDKVPKGFGASLANSVRISSGTKGENLVLTVDLGRVLPSSLATTRITLYKGDLPIVTKVTHTGDGKIGRKIIKDTDTLRLDRCNIIVEAEWNNSLGVFRKFWWDNFGRETWIAIQADLHCDENTDAEKRKKNLSDLRVRTIA